jgi:ABC-type glutathione transport system ATPase component
MLLRLIEPDRGALSYTGVDLLALSGSALRQQRRHLQMIFQDPFTSFDPRLTIRNALEEALRVHLELTREERSERIHDLLDKVRLGSFALDRKPAQLSGGELQRASLARALASSPAVVVCDEPISALDVSIGAQILNLLLDLQESEHLSLVFISHDLRAVRAVADEVMVMRAGKVVEHAPADELFEDPRDDYTRELLRAVRGDRSVRHGRVTLRSSGEGNALEEGVAATEAAPSLDAADQLHL